MITINSNKGKRNINGRDIDEAIKDFSKDDKEYEIIKNAFESISSEEDLINQLKSEKDNISKASILLCLKVILNSSISDVYPLFDRIFEDDSSSAIIT